MIVGQRSSVYLKNTALRFCHARSYSTRYIPNNTIGIVREVYNTWERRVALNPDHVKKLVSQNINVIVQPCNKRVYTNDEYIEAGAIIKENLEDACLILGVKQVPVENLIPDRTYMFFSHVIKAQKENMELLDNLLEKNIRMIDYECITDDSNTRLVAFGRFAGIAGMIDILNGAGQKLLARGFGTSFLNSSVTYTHRDLAKAKTAVSEIGKHLVIPGDVSPLIFAFTGTGKVAQGAQEIFELLPHTYVKSVEELEGLIKSKKGKPTREVYGVIVTDRDMVERTNGGGYNKKEYRENPETYSPIFHSKVAPYISVLVNCMYWDSSYPRLITKDQQKELQKADGRLFAVSDISCDIEGSIEYLHNSTTIEQPFFNYDALTDEIEYNTMIKEGVLVSGVDILPTQLPRDASTLFGNALVPFISSLVDPSLADKQSLSSLPSTLSKACITNEGSITKPFKYIETLRAANETSGKDFQHQMKVRLYGHIFDSNIINQVMDLIEGQNGDFHILQCETRANTNDVKRASKVIFEIRAESKEQLDAIITKLELFVSVFDKEQVVMKHLLK